MSSHLEYTLREVAKRYPPELTPHQLDDVPRIQFHIEMVQRLVQNPNPAIADIGGGLGLFTPGCAAVGMQATLVDDFLDKVNLTSGGTSALKVVHGSLGVRVVQRDITKGVEFPTNHFDVITCFETMEHLHHSPKRLFHDLVESLKPGGWLILSTPNCVNLRARVTVPLGYGKWSTMTSWYESESFRGHVREPDVDDLRSIAKDLGLRNVRILGRNWRPIPGFVNRLIQLRPSLCFSIYMAGRKP